jgi:large subunit ribosomal protein L5e
MPFVKVQKNKAYFMRYQVRYRRRREGKTDYRARRAMVLQDKTKYDTPKYRMVVRITNRDVVCQIVHAKVVGDEVICAAYGHELPAFGVKVGLTNYASAYATGLLLARRTLAKLKIDGEFKGQETADGKYTQVRTKADDLGQEGRFPFKAILDVGLTRTTTGARVFGCLKGAVDGGIAIPHKPNRFPGFSNGKLDAKVHREHIMGVHVGKWLDAVLADKKANPDEKTVQFDNFAKNGLNNAKDVEAMYKAAHAAIRKSPTTSLPKKKAVAGATSKAYNIKALTHKERSAAAKKKVAALRKTRA